MKFGETFMEYLHAEQDGFLDKCAHVEYKRLKKVLKTCRSCRNGEQEQEEGEKQNNTDYGQLCQCQSCPLCDKMFFSELMKEVADVAGCFSSRAKHLLHLHVARGVQRYALRLRQCFKSDNKLSMIEEGRMLIEYVTMNAIAIRKILKKYDKVHRSVNGVNFKSKLRAEHIELLQSPWLIELGAFYLNLNGSDAGECNEFCGHFSCDLNAMQPVMKLMLPNSIELEYNLTCAICLEMVFNPYALSRGHLFCKLCACSSASVAAFEGLKTANQNAKCPICREAGVYVNSVHMLELDLLFKRRCKDYWKERMVAERAELIRKEALWACFAMEPNYEAMRSDVCVPLSRLAELISRSKVELDVSPLLCTVIAHAGDGNFHTVILFDPEQEEQRREAERLNHFMVHTALSMEGTCTGEHGVGTGKIKYLEKELGVEALRTMKRIKATLDPNNIMNPGKLISPHICL